MDHVLASVQAKGFFRPVSIHQVYFIGFVEGFAVSGGLLFGPSAREGGPPENERGSVQQAVQRICTPAVTLKNVQTSRSMQRPQPTHLPRYQSFSASMRYRVEQEMVLHGRSDVFLGGFVSKQHVVSGLEHLCILESNHFKDLERPQEATAKWNARILTCL